MLHGRLVHVGETPTDLQILGCELHQNAFGSRALPGLAGGSYGAPQDSLAVITGRRGREKKELKIG